MICSSIKGAKPPPFDTSLCVCVLLPGMFFFSLNFLLPPPGVHRKICGTAVVQQYYSVLLYYSPSGNTLLVVVVDDVIYHVISITKPFHQHKIRRRACCVREVPRHNNLYFEV